jgi:hypothetical protein
LQRQREAGAIRCDVSVEVLAQYLALVFEGLVSHLALGSSTEGLEAVPEMVESSVRRCYHVVD